MIIVAEKRRECWSAWIDGHPETAFGGDSAATAATRVAESRGLDPTRVRLTGVPTMTRMHLRIPTETCPVCCGLKTYVGLHAVEPCGNCEGQGDV